MNTAPISHLTSFDVPFDEWYAACDAFCMSLAGVGIEDLSDGPSRDAYNDETTVREYVYNRLDEDGFPF